MRQDSESVLYTFAMIQLFQSPRAAAHIESVSQSFSAMPKPREVILGSKSVLLEAAVFCFGIFIVVGMAATPVGRNGSNVFSRLFALAVSLFVMLAISAEILRELRNRSLLTMGACSAGNVTSQRWIKSRRSRRSEITYVFPVGDGKPMRGSATDLTGEYVENMPVLVFYDPDDISRNVAICCTRWRLRTNEGFSFEP